MSLLFPMVRLVVRAVNWLPLLITAVFIIGVSFATDPGSTLDARTFAVTLRISALALGAAGGFALVDVMTEVATPTPLQRWVVQWTRLLLAFLCAMAVWAVGCTIMASTFPEDQSLALSGLTIEAIVLVLSSLAVTAIAVRRRAEPVAAVTGAAVMFVLAVLSLPYRDVIWPTPGDLSWEDVHAVWLPITIIPLAVLTVANREIR